MRRREILFGSSTGNVRIRKREVVKHDYNMGWRQQSLDAGALDGT
jgi:hypothetical protein